MLKYLFFAVFMLFPFAANAQIAGSAHDFSTTGWSVHPDTSNVEICLPCHTPHNGTTGITDAPLWNHTVTSSTFTTYSTTTLDATVGAPAGVSLLCLSCHDGSVALDSFGGATGATTISGDANFGTDLSNDHPISFTYDTTLATNDGELFDPATANSGLGSTITSDLLFGGLMECASCHDVHATANDFMLHIANTSSALCLTCHDK